MSNKAYRRMWSQENKKSGQQNYNKGGAGKAGKNPQAMIRNDQDASAVLRNVIKLKRK